MNIRNLRIVAILEGISYLLLGLTMPLKYLFEMPKPNYFVGMAHGILFIAYIILVLVVGRRLKWDLTTMFWSLLASLIPFGTFVADAKIFKQYQSKG